MLTSGKIFTSALCRNVFSFWKMVLEEKASMMMKMTSIKLYESETKTIINLSHGKQLQTGSSDWDILDCLHNNGFHQQAHSEWHIQWCRCLIFHLWVPVFLGSYLYYYDSLCWELSGVFAAITNTVSANVAASRHAQTFIHICL
ncbi:hypothetical protein ScPMuIL_007874 [Solemya velum]